MFGLAQQLFDEFLKTNHQNLKSEFYIPIIVNEMIKRNAGKVKVISGGTTWFGVTYQEDKESVSSKISELVKKGDYPEKLWA